MATLEIKKNIFSVGVQDPSIRVFDVLMKAEHGSSYNSYLIKGLNKTALIDTVKEKFKDQFFANLKSLTDLKKLDYVIINHTEADHSGSLKHLLTLAPQIKIVGSKTSQHFIEHLLNKKVDILKVGDGDKIDLGGKTLEFISAPFLHWPDTMFTYLKEDKILFPCDFLGCHYSDDRLFNDLVDDFSYAFKYYFDVIIRPFKEYALAALDKIKPLPLEIVCPSHGPVLKKDVLNYIGLYRKWAGLPEKVPGEKNVLIFFASAYGNTARMAEQVARGAEEAKGKVAIFDVAALELPIIVDEVEKADALVVGSITINGDAVKPVWDLLSSLATLKLKGKVGAVFGSYGWSGEGVKMIAERLKGLKFTVPFEPVTAVFTPTEEDLKKCFELGKKVVEAV